MIKRLAVITLFGLLISGCSSSKKLNVWTKQTKVNQVREFEFSVNPDLEIISKNVSISETIFPSVKEFTMSNPLIIRREKTGILTNYAEYFYSKPDSTLRYVSYNWEDNRYGNYNDQRKEWTNQSKKLNDYNAEYERIKKQLIKQFGSAIKQDNEPQETKSNYGGPNYLSRNTVWESDKDFMKLSMVFGAATYRIRLNYYWK